MNIANMLIKIKNAQAADKDAVEVPFSKINFEIAKILKNKKFIEDVEKKERKEKKSNFTYINVKLKYQEGKGVINNFKLISKPSRRVYTGRDEIKSVKSGYGISVVSTSKGLMTGEEARKAQMGGEMLFEVW